MKARLFALLALLVVPAWAATQDATPFHLLEGREVARSLPVRDFEAALFAWLADGMLALDAEGPVHLDLRGRVVDRLDPCPAAKDAEAVELSAPRDGAWAVGRYADGHVCTWEGTALRSSGGGDVTAVALGNSPTAAWGYADGRVEGRDPRTGRRRWTRNPDLGPVRTLRFETAGPRVVGATGTNGAFVLDTRSGRLVRGLRGPPAYAGAFDPRGDRVAIGRADGKVELWDTTQWYRTDTLRFTGGDVVEIEWSPDGEQLAVALDRKGTASIEVWDFGDDDLVFREDAPAAGTVHLRFDHAGERLVASVGTVSRAWAKPGARSIPRPPPSDEPPHKRPINDDVELPPLAVAAPVGTAPGALRLGPGVTLARATADTVVPPSPAPATSPPTSPAPTPILAGQLVAIGTSTVPLAGSATATAPFELAVDGGRAAAWEGGRLAVWDTSTGAQIGRIAVAHPRSVALLGARVGVVTDDGKAFAGTLERLKAIPGVTNATTLALDPFHGDRVGVGLSDGTVKVLDTTRGTTLGAWGVHAGEVTALAFSTDGAHLAAAGPPPGATGARVVVLSAERKEDEEAPWTARLDTTVRRLVYNDGRFLAVADHTVAVLDRRGPLLELFAPIVDAAWQGTSVRWVDPRGDVRVAVPTTFTPSLPRGRFLARSADSEWTLTVDGDRVSVWDDRTGRLLREAPGSGSPVRAAVFERTGARVAVLDAAGSVEVYDVASGEALRHLESGPSTWMRFSDDGTLLWLVGDHAVVGWDIATGTARETVPLSGTIAPDGTVGLNRFVQVLPDAWLDVATASTRRLVTGTRPLAVTADGRRLAVVVDGGVEIRDTGSDRRLQGPLVVEGDTPAVAGAFTEDGCYFAATYASGVIRVWEVERPQATLEGDGQIRSTALDARRVRLVVTLGADARLLSRATVAPIVSITFEEGEALLVARDATGFARMWEWRLSEEAPQLGTGAGPVLPVTGVNALLYADDHLYTAWDDGFVRSFQLATGVQDAMLLGHAGAVTSLAVSADAATLVTGSADGTVRTWSTATGVQKLAFNTFADPVRRVALSPEGFRAAAIGDDKVLRTWDATKGKALRRWKVDADVTALRVTADRAEVTLADGTRWALFLETGAVGRVEASPPIVSGGGAPPRNAPPGAAPLDPPDPLAIPRDLATQLGPISQELRADAQTWVVADAEGRIQIWDLESASLRGVLRALSDGSWMVERPDGSRYASESLRDGTSPLLHRPPPK